jgi:hypothetical protein
MKPESASSYISAGMPIRVGNPEGSGEVAGGSTDSLEKTRNSVSLGQATPTNHLSALPSEVLCNIFSYLDPAARRSLGATDGVHRRVYDYVKHQWAGSPITTEKNYTPRAMALTFNQGIDRLRQHQANASQTIGDERRTELSKLWTALKAFRLGEVDDRSSDLKIVKHLMNIVNIVANSSNSGELIAHLAKSNSGHVKAAVADFVSCVEVIHREEERLQQTVPHVPVLKLYTDLRVAGPSELLFPNLKTRKQLNALRSLLDVATAQRRNDPRLLGATDDTLYELSHKLTVKLRNTPEDPSDAQRQPKRSFISRLTSAFR